MNEGVEVEVVMHLVHPDGGMPPILTVLSYHPSDPYAMSVTFIEDEDERITWTFARDLLAQGLDEPVGLGDVGIWPYTSLTGRNLCLALSSPDGDASFLLRRQDAARFLARAYQLVPRGREGDQLDIDQTIKALLSGR